MPEKMTERDLLVEIRTESKIQTDMLRLQNKILFALVGAMVGVQFIPNSPIDVARAMNYAVGFLSVFALILLSIKTWGFRGKINWAGCLPVTDALIGVYILTAIIIFCVQPHFTPEWFKYAVDMFLIVFFIVVIKWSIKSEGGTVNRA